MTAPVVRQGVRILLFLFLSLAGAGAEAECDRLLANLTAVRRAGGHLYGVARPGEHVTIGPAAGGNFDWDATDSAGDSILMSLSSPYPARLIKFLPQRRARVRLLDGDEEILDIPLADLTAHADPRVQKRRFWRQLRALAPGPLSFSLGERVRVRAANLMTEGVVTSLSPLEVDGIPRSSASIFKWVAPHPHSLILTGGDRRTLDVGVPRAHALKFMNAVARWTSREDFLALSPARQMTLLARLTVAVASWHNSTLIADDVRDLTVSGLLLKGFGVCRHLNPLTAAVLAETGFAVRVVSRDLHLWTEAQTIDNEGRRDEWAVESSCRLDTSANAYRLRDLPEYPTKLSADYYLHPDREVRYVSPSWLD